MASWKFVFFFLWSPRRERSEIYRALFFLLPLPTPTSGNHQSVLSNYELGFFVFCGVFFWVGGVFRFHI